jgi:hypothetical protein
VIATLALFIALGGTSYAAIALPKNSVGARELKRGAVTGAEVRNGSLHARELRVGSRPARVSYARVRRGGVDGEITLDLARGMKVFKTQGALVTLQITDRSLQSIESRRACAVSAMPVASRLDIEDSGPVNPGGTFLELNDEFIGAILVYAFDRDGNPAASSFDLTMVCPRP